MTEAANPAQPEAVNVSDVPSASAAIEGLLEPTPQEEGQPEAANDAPERAEVQVEATPENEPEVEAEADVEQATDEEVTTEEDAEAEEYMVEVTLPGGEKTEVALDELQRSYSREADYTRKTERVAAERREVAEERDQMRSAFEAERQQYVQQLAYLANQVDKDLVADQRVDWEALKEEDPIEFATQWADHQRKAEARNAAQFELQKAQQQDQARQAQEYQAMLAGQQQRLVEVMPDFGDQEKAQAKKGEIRNFLKGNYGGFSDDEIGGIVDARHVQLINDAMQWRSLQSSKGAVEKKLKPLPKVVKPSARKSKADNEAEQRVAKIQRAKRSGSIDDAASVLADLI